MRLTKQEVKSSPNRSSRRILLRTIAGLAAIALLGGGGYLAWQKPRSCPEGQLKIGGQCVAVDPSPDSLEENSEGFHKDTRYGISVEYPKSWELREARRDYRPSAFTGTKDLFQLLTPGQGGGSYQENILVKIEQVAEPPYLDEYADKQVARIKQLGTFSIESQQPIKLGEQSAREIIYSGNDGEYNLRRRRIIAEPKIKDDYFLLITYTADINDYDRYLSDVNRVFESITLLD